VLGPLLAAASFIVGLGHFSLGLSPSRASKLVVAFWALVPPTFLWLDWVVLCAKVSAEEREGAKHTHELARNIWLALVGVLIVLFNLHWSSAGG
jgi:hypothetical protein